MQYFGCFRELAIDTVPNCQQPLLEKLAVQSYFDDVDATYAAPGWTISNAVDVVVSFFEFLLCFC